MKGGTGIEKGRNRRKSGSGGGGREEHKGMEERRGLKRGSNGKVEGFSEEGRLKKNER